MRCAVFNHEDGHYYCELPELWAMTTVFIATTTVFVAMKTVVMPAKGANLF